jgi:glycosyltransferase involved in cell wall biosynthesis
MDIFVQPSLSEAFSQVLIEAMGVGLPVIATDVGGAREVIVDGECGVLIEPDVVSQIAEVTLRIMNDDTGRTIMALAGRTRVMSEFTVSRMVDRQFALYSEWLADRRSGSVANS